MHSTAAAVKVGHYVKRLNVKKKITMSKLKHTTFSKAFFSKPMLIYDIFSSYKGGFDMKVNKVKSFHDFDNRIFHTELKNNP